MKSRILHPTDFSATADRALRIAIEYARLHAAPIDLVHVEHLTATVMSRGATAASEKPQPYVAESLEERARLIRSAGIDCETFALVGSAGSAILDHAGQHRNNLIVMGTHGRSGIANALIGSVAAHVARYAECPVLMVGPKH
jgi:nucleotide-binding universal stress UspA family protein